MIEEKYIDLVTAYLEDSLSPDQRAELNNLIDSGEIDVLDIKEMELLYQRMGKIPSAEPSHQLRERFYSMLEEKKTKEAPSLTKLFNDWVEGARPYFSMPRIAYTLSILMVGIVIGNWVTPFQNYRQQLSDLSTEVSQMREVMALTLLDNSSATERLKAVNISSDIRSVDSRITDALFKTLNNDPNVNVRLAAVEALVEHSTAPDVRKRLVGSISKQESPLVQAAMADAMLILQEKRSVKEFRQLLDQDGIDPGVRDKLQNTIAALS